jgi:hypothetical protein
MKSKFFGQHKFLIPAVVTMLAALCQTAQATPYVSNLGDVWPEAGTIGDIHGLFRGGTPYGSDTATFTTGAGQFSLNFISLEFQYSSSNTGGLTAQNYVSVLLYAHVGGGNVLIGTLGNPVADSAPTQWPQSSFPRNYTTFVDFSPLSQISLNPFTQYSVVISMPSTSPVDAALMFTRSADYISQSGWTMGETVTGNPFIFGEHLKIAVDARAVPDQSNTAGLLGCALILLFGCYRSVRRKSLRLR